MFSLIKFVIAHPMALWSGITSAHLVKYFVATRIHMYPRDGGLTCPTKSNLQVWKGHGVTMLGKFYGWVWIKWLVLGNCDIFSQILLCLFSWWANNNPSVAGICINFSSLGAPHILLHVPLLSFPLLLRGPNSVMGLYHTFSWKGFRHAKSSALPTF